MHSILTQNFTVHKIVNKKHVIIGIIVFVIAMLLFSFTGLEKDVEVKETPENGETGQPSITNWKEAELINIQDGSTYTIASLSDKPILLESFAVWCPTCTRQQREVKELHEDSDFGDKFYSIGLDTDENEDAERVLGHVRQNGFDWRYSVSNNKLTNALIDEFTFKIVNAPSAPMVLICQGNQMTHFLELGVKSSDELKESITTLCNI
jgi:hypothetical protein